MLRTLLLLLCLIGLMAAPIAAQAQEQAQQNAPLTIEAGSLDHLISTLESEEKRQEFIDNLKTLVQTDQKQQQSKSADLAISEALGIEGYINRAIKKYENFLLAHNLNGTIIGKALITFITMMIATIIITLNRKACLLLRDKMTTLRDKFQLGHDRFRLYARIIRYASYALVGIFFIYSLGVIWDFSTFEFMQHDLSVLILGNVISILFIAIVAIIIWETINGIIEHYLRNADAANFSSYNRLRTLLPIIQNVLFMVFAALFTLVILSELGINILPLLAGAGILGIAIGFGAQTMVKDFLTGFVIILEDVVQVGDVAKIAGHTGLIEKITMRKIQLRDVSGIVYTVPYSEISTVENWTKDFSYYVLEVGVAYRENTDEVAKLLREVDEDLRADENFKDLILDPIEILGVDKFADSAVIIKARIKTKPIQQWNVGREFNRRMKMKFDEHNVEIPFPHQTIYFGENKQGKAPPASIILQEAPSDKSKSPKKNPEKKNSK